MNLIPVTSRPKSSMSSPPIRKLKCLPPLGQREDIEILTAPLGRLGLELAQEHHPDLILMDIDLPDINGFDVFRCLQGLDATKHIPVVALSAHAMKDTIEKAKDLGFKDYLTKPVDVDLFFSTLDLYLKK